MAYYTYKSVCHDIPSHIEEKFEERYGREPDGDPNYNGDCWTLVSMWIEELENDLTPNPQKVTIPIETLRHLMRRDAELSALEGADVDLWDGYGGADYSEVDKILVMSINEIREEYEV